MPNAQNPYSTPEETASVLSCRSLTNNEQWLEDQLDRISPERHEMGSAGDTIALQKLAFELKTEIDRLRTLADEGFSACDMASASAQGFRDGQMASGVPTSWPCEIVEANFEKNKVTIEMGCTDYVISAGTHYLSKAAPEAPASKQASHPIPADISADLERSDWTAEEALRWYAAGKHYDTVPNGDGTSSARILDNGAVASNALKSMSIEYAKHKGDVALTEAPAQCPVIEDQVPAAYFATHPNVTDRCDGGKPRMLRKEHVVNYLHSGWRVWAVMDDIAITAPDAPAWQELSEEDLHDVFEKAEKLMDSTFGLSWRRAVAHETAVALREKNGGAA